ncbi:MAG TPA: hypothetical protein VML94_05580 [Thermoplasmata archaeon]|nr:hypothetical protein [Thermoplasmata archaeon]
MARAARRTPPRKPRPLPRRTVVREVRPAGVALSEDPHAHVVCRVCGRIQSLDLNELDRHLLTELAALHPEGWSVEQIAFSLTGACRRCREGPTVR